MLSTSTSSTSFYHNIQTLSTECKICGKSFSARGMNLHITKPHGNSTASHKTFDASSSYIHHSSNIDKSDLDHDLNDTAEYIPCPICLEDNINKKFEGDRGLHIHWKKLHKEVPCPNNESQGDFETKLQNGKKSIHISRRIPKGARVLAADRLSYYIN
ncbi:hypothetical protein C0J52_26130 [Blattella germanica]|nr:hypothetical protein C0J52_26130 [Blattella germanica]